ncbi:hypothetical protein LX36DRAFT_241900 [Colletotrichum falcatum]|nr:hypothetical protein LX36DRAFT_241900 [Colletotrichum falcatum]
MQSEPGVGTMLTDSPCSQEGSWSRRQSAFSRPEPGGFFCSKRRNETARQKFGAWVSNSRGCYDGWQRALEAWPFRSVSSNVHVKVVPCSAVGGLSKHHVGTMFRFVPRSRKLPRRGTAKSRRATVTPRGWFPEPRAGGCLMVCRGSTRLSLAALSLLTSRGIDAPLEHDSHSHTVEQ